MIEYLEIGAVLIATTHIVGFAFAVDALYLTRTPQGAIAWGLSLVMLPYLSIPLYLIFGRSRFQGYRSLVRRFSTLYGKELAEHRNESFKYISPSTLIDRPVERTFEAIANAQFVTGNEIKLLIDGAATFEAIFQAIRQAKKYILIQFFIVRDDRLGKDLRDYLIERTKAGVKVQVLYDEMGSEGLSSEYIESLRQAGVEIHFFATRQGWNNFFQFNFRNHRKITVVDGKVAFVGGLNVGDEYLGRDKNIGNWRDTHVEIHGPAIVPIQSIFFSDWYWATRKAPTVDWKSSEVCGDIDILSVASGPADKQETCSLFFSEAIRSANERIWISSPYFVPDEAICRELQLAALRGVDVRLIVPDRCDHYLVWLASFFYISEIFNFGVRIFRYKNGFLHQKVLLVDNTLSAVGTANMDNRSFRLNFEIMILVSNQKFNSDVARMLEDDMSKCEEKPSEAFDLLPLWKRLLSKFARLFAPIL